MSIRIAFKEAMDAAFQLKDIADTLSPHESRRPLTSYTACTIHENLLLFKVVLSDKALGNRREFGELSHGRQNRMSEVAKLRLCRVISELRHVPQEFA